VGTRAGDVLDDTAGDDELPAGDVVAGQELLPARVGDLEVVGAVGKAGRVVRRVLARATVEVDRLLAGVVVEVDRLAAGVGREDRTAHGSGIGDRRGRLGRHEEGGHRDQGRRH